MVQEIYNLEGKKVWVPGMPPLGCSSSLRSQLGGSCCEKNNFLHSSNEYFKWNHIFLIKTVLIILKMNIHIVMKIISICN